MKEKTRDIVGLSQGYLGAMLLSLGGMNGFPISNLFILFLENITSFIESSIGI